jgi:hypothetical protein
VPRRGRVGRWRGPGLDADVYIFLPSSSGRANREEVMRIGACAGTMSARSRARGAGGCGGRERRARRKLEAAQGRSGRSGRSRDGRSRQASAGYASQARPCHGAAAQRRGPAALFRQLHECRPIYHSSALLQAPVGPVGSAMRRAARALAGGCAPWINVKLEQEVLFKGTFRLKPRGVSWRLLHLRSHHDGSLFRTDPPSLRSSRPRSARRRAVAAETSARSSLGRQSR